MVDTIGNVIKGADMKNFLKLASIGLALFALTNMAQAADHHSHHNHTDHITSSRIIPGDDRENRTFAASADDSAELMQQIRAYRLDIAGASRLLRSQNPETRLAAQQLISSWQGRIFQLQGQIDELQ